MFALVIGKFEKVMLAGNVVLIIALFVLAMQLFKNYKNNNIAKKILTLAKENENQRKSYEEEIRIKEGNQEKDSLMFKLDLLLERSGIKRQFKITTEIFIIIQLVLFLAVFIIVSKIVGSWMLGFGAGVSFIVLCYGVIKFMNMSQQKKIEGQIIQFINLLENSSRQSDDIIYIFGQVYKFLDEPLRSYIYECYSEAYNSGDADTALQRLELKVQHPKLKDIIRNLLICSHHEANYEAIIKDSRRSVKLYLANLEERKAVLNNARVEIMIILIVGIFMIQLVGNILEMHVLKFLLTGGLIGQSLIAYMLVVFIIAVVKLINISDK